MDSLTTRFNNNVFNPYIEFIKTQYKFHERFIHVRDLWNKKLNAEELVNGPYLEKSQTYSYFGDFEKLGLSQGTIKTIKKKLNGRNLYTHQFKAIKNILAGRNVVVATGTSSGKTLCYQLPIIEDLLRNPGVGLRAIIIYPLNALVNDQLTEWEELLSDYHSITFARFTGQTPDDQGKYLERQKNRLREKLKNENVSQNDLEKSLAVKCQELLERDKYIIPNRLNHRESIRKTPPNILITNFSMLEYLLERPIDAPIFNNSRLKFLVLDEAHAYRGVQATEIAFLIRRVKEHLSIDKLTCIATSATLGKKDDAESLSKVTNFSKMIFNDTFEESDIIYGDNSDPEIIEPAKDYFPEDYLKKIELLKNGEKLDYSFLNNDKNLYKLKKEILTKPILLIEAAKKIWPAHKKGQEGLQALLEIVATAESEHLSDENLLSTRLHYFIKAQDGLYVCLHQKCPGRNGDVPAFYLSRRNEDSPIGDCPACFGNGIRSKLVELVSCRKCGYLFGALQDLGPTKRVLQNSGILEIGEERAHFDSFTTELGWGADSFWTYFLLNPEFPLPFKEGLDEEDEGKKVKREEISWCTSCGKKSGKGIGDLCKCSNQNLRQIQIIHRQCPSDKFENIDKSQKVLINSCPNCGSKNNLGIEPLKRFQESEDENGIAMAIPFAHFEVTEGKGKKTTPKLLCFTDHRQRAAAFPSLLEEETFVHDFGRGIVKLINLDTKKLSFIELGEKLFDMTVPGMDLYDSKLFLPVSRYPDDEPDSKAKRDLWIAEIFGYFGIPDAARESAEDIGLVAVEYQLDSEDLKHVRSLFKEYGLSEKQGDDAFQILCSFLRKRKAFTLPQNRVAVDSPAFGNVTVDIGFRMIKEGFKNANGWLPKINKDQITFRNNVITGYLERLIQKPPAKVYEFAKKIWELFTTRQIFHESRGIWKLDHERLKVGKSQKRFVCTQCGIVSLYSALDVCPKPACNGKLKETPFVLEKANIIEQWVSGKGKYEFSSLRSEEHTAQISKDLAKTIEDKFRFEGINLLSSTTTFEMGINIGDLQKVLLRNAPPSSANYVQRVGRAGRGKDKNAICVTLCRRTKYDLDQWMNPPRLMSGEVKPASVFVSNQFIAQRHFNAIVFSKFLRHVVEEKKLTGNLKQKIRLELFLNPDARKEIPEGWIHANPGSLFLDFIGWATEKTENSVISTESGKGIYYPTIKFDEANIRAIAKYKEIISDIEIELVEMMAERKKLFDSGMTISDAESSIRNLLGSDVISVLAKRGFLPRYAFPLDVVTLETSRSRWTKEDDVELSRDRGLAIAEFAPGGQIIAHKKVFTSAGLYKIGTKDEFFTKWYSECSGCGQIRTAETKGQLQKECEICHKAATGKKYKKYIEPVSFSVRTNTKKGDGGERYRKSKLIRQRQTITHFIDSVQDGDFVKSGNVELGLKEDGTLFRYNAGPDGQGFMLCPLCGCSEAMRDYTPSKRHERLRITSDSTLCECETVLKEISYGHQFKSFCLIIRPKKEVGSVESLAFGFQRGLCNVLEIDSRDIGVAWRWLVDKRKVPEIEIILYDLTPGGAGFAKEAFGKWDEVVKETKNICKSCSCDNSCYDCLKTYSNQVFHDLLDRNKVLAFVE